MFRLPVDFGMSASLSRTDAEAQKAPQLAYSSSFRVHKGSPGSQTVLLKSVAAGLEAPVGPSHRYSTRMKTQVGYRRYCFRSTATWQHVFFARQSDSPRTHAYLFSYSRTRRLGHLCTLRLRCFSWTPWHHSPHPPCGSM